MQLDSTKSVLEGLSDLQRDAANTIDEDIEIIACAGSGKTRVITRRIINILQTKKDVTPENIVAFTFTENAASEMKDRIYQCGEEFIGGTQGFAAMYVGTIHGFCKNVLQEYVEEFEKYQVLQGTQELAFIKRFSYTLNKTPLSYTNYRGYVNNYNLMNYQRANYIEGIEAFAGAVSLIIEKSFSSSLTNQEKAVFDSYKDLLYSHKYITFSLLEYEVVQRLKTDPEFARKCTEKLKYLIVDEYQDVNPVQEILIEELHKYGCNLCVVGDDDQLIYSFRGSNPRNILDFCTKFGVKKQVILDTNYRCSEGIVRLAESVVSNNQVRFPKEMKSGGAVSFEKGDIVYKNFNSPEAEADFIVDQIEQLHNQGMPYRDMAVLVRVQKTYHLFVERLDAKKVPYRVKVPSGLMYTPECIAAIRIFKHIGGATSSGVSYSVFSDDSRDTYENLRIGWNKIGYKVDAAALDKAINDLEKYREIVQRDQEREFGHELNLQDIYLSFLATAGILEDQGDPIQERLFYNLGAFSQVIQDFESVSFTRKPVNKVLDFLEFANSNGCGDKYCEGYLNNAFVGSDNLNIMTIHAAKGLEYSAVFMPTLDGHIFPNEFFCQNDRAATEEERRVFYVGVTRAKKYLYLTNGGTYDYRGDYVCSDSRFLTEAKMASAYIEEYTNTIIRNADLFPECKVEQAPISLNFSLLSNFFDCPYKFKLSSVYGFQQPLSQEIGYGKSIHEAVEHIHKRYLNGESYDDLESIVDLSLFLPYANPSLMETNKKRGIQTVEKYVRENERFFKYIEFAEAPIELDLGDGIKVNGRIDLVLKKDEQGKTTTSIVDFKTQKRAPQENISEHQLKIYALGYEQLTGTGADNIEIYNLEGDTTDRENVAVLPVSNEMTSTVKEIVVDAANSIRNNQFLRRETCDGVCDKCYYRRQCRK